MSNEINEMRNITDSNNTRVNDHRTRRIVKHDAQVVRLWACLHGVGDPGLVGLVSFVFTLWGTQNKRNLPH